MSSPLSGGSSLISNASTTALGLGNLALVVPAFKNGFAQTKGYQPKNPRGSDPKMPLKKAFVFDYEGEQTLKFSSDITDYQIEDNTPVEDQIALKPIKITTKGFVSELNDIPPDFLLPVRDIAQKLTVISAYAPAVSATALIAYNEALFAYQTAMSIANSAVSAWSSINGGVSPSILDYFPNQSKQQIACGLFVGYWRQRTRFIVQTPWGIFDDMVIEDLHPIQSEDTQSYTTFEITFKQIITIKSAIADDINNSQGRKSTNAAPLVGSNPTSPRKDIGLGAGLEGSSFSSAFA